MSNAEQLRKAQHNSTFVFDPKTMVDKNGVPLYFTKENATKIGGEFEKRKAETFETLQKMYSKEQVGFIAHRGCSLFTEAKTSALIHKPMDSFINQEMSREF